MLSFLARALLAQLLVIEAFLSSYVMAERLLRREPALLRWTGVVVCGALLSSIGFHLLCTLGAFRPLGAAVSLTIVMWALIQVGQGDHGLRRWLRRDARFVGKLRCFYRRSPYRMVVLGFVAVSLPGAIRPLGLPPLAWDTLTYHAVKAAMWVQHAGSLPMNGPGTWSYYPTMWAGGEVFTSWAMLPFHSDLLAMEVDAVEWVALGVALLALAREVGIREPYASAAAGFVLAIPTLRISVGSGYVETALLLMAVSGWALAARFLERGALGALYLSSAALGIASGIKFPFLPLGLLALAIVCARAITLQAPQRVPVHHVAAAIALFVAILAPWPWNAYRQTGLPLSPLPVELFGKRLGKPTPEVEWYMDRSNSPDEGKSELGMLKQALLQERMGPGLTTMVAVAVSVVGAPFLWRRHALGLLLLGSTVIATCMEYFAPGLSVVRHFFTSSGVRFLLPALVPCVISSVAFCRFYPQLGRPYLLFLFAGTFFQMLLYLPYGLSAPSVEALSILTFGLWVFVAAVRWIAQRPFPIRLRLTAVIALLTVALSGLNELRNELRIGFFREEFAIHPIHPYWVEAVALVDSAEPPRRIAVTSGPMQDLDNWVVYPFMGRSLQNEVLYVPISRDGALHHFGSGTLNDEYAQAGDFATWAARLRDRAVTEVMSFRPASIELGWMEEHPLQFRQLAGERGEWGLFAVLNPPTHGVLAKQTTRQG